MSSVLVGVFDSAAAAQQARSRLLEAGFASNAISMTDEDGATTSMTGAAADADQGTVGGKAHQGGIAGFFERLFGDDDDDQTTSHSSTYREAFRRGHFGLTVATQSDSETDDAEAILNEAGAIDVDEHAQQWRRDGWDGAGTTGDAMGDSMGGTTTGATLLDGTGTTGTAQEPSLRDSGSIGTMADGTTQKLDMVEERLAVGKRAVSRGGVRIYSRMVEVPVEESVRLREEHTDVQTRAVDRPATEADFAAFKEGSIEIRDTAEEAVVAKTARVVGEVEIGKRVTERDETISDTVRKTEVDVERIDDTEDQGSFRTGTTGRP